MANQFIYTGTDPNKKALASFLAGFLKENAAVYYTPRFSDDAELSKYACYVEQKSKSHHQPLKKMFFDVKICAFYEKHFLLDLERYEYLKKFETDNTTILYYTIFTPQNTVVFNLSDLWDQNKIRFEDSRKFPGKKVAVLRVYEAKEINFLHNPPKTKQKAVPQPVQPTQKVYEAFPEETTVPLKPIKPTTSAAADKKEAFEMEQQTFTGTSYIKEFNKDRDKIFGIQRDENGQIILTTLDHWKDLPKELQSEYADINYIIMRIPDRAKREALLLEYAANTTELAKLIRRNRITI